MIERKRTGEVVSSAPDGTPVSLVPSPSGKTRYQPASARGPPDERLIRMREVQGLTGLGRSTIHRLIAQGRFPKQIHPFGNRMAAWRYSEVSAWIAARCSGEAA